MRSEITPEANEFRSPLFVSPLPFLYRMVFRDTRRRKNEITYTTPHEIILNLHAYANEDQIVYINRQNNQEVFTITVDRFKVMLAETFYNVSYHDLELLLMRLSLTNRYSKSIIDKGHFRYLDGLLRDHLCKLKGGYDGFLTYEKQSVILYFKYRRDSAVVLLSILREFDRHNDIQIYHINIPKTIPNQGLIYECLRVEFNKRQFRLYTYDPVEEDNIQPKKADVEIIQVLNQLIK